MMEDFERRDGSAIICPYCGAENCDAWERRSEEGVDDCDCGKKFRWKRETSVEYISNADCLLNKEEHDYDDSCDWLSNKDNTEEEFRVCQCKKCSDYKIERRAKQNTETLPKEFL
jgi:hypothetical protein